MERNVKPSLAVKMVPVRLVEWKVGVAKKVLRDADAMEYLAEKIDMNVQILEVWNYLLCLKIDIICNRYAISSCKLKLDISILLGCRGGDSCCTSKNRCDIDQGDCDSDSDCKIGLKCGNDNCPKKSGHEWDSGDDCCYKPMPG